MTHTEDSLILSTATAGKIKLTRTGLSFLEAPTFDEWKEIGQHLFSAEQSIQWAIGDWLIYGEDNLVRVEKGRYEQVMAILGEKYSYTTLRSFAYTSRSFGLLERSNKLNWSQHYIIAKSGEDNRDKWLKVVTNEADKGNVVPSRLLRRSIECGELLKPEDLKVPPEDKGIDNHCNWIVGLRNWWRNFKDCGWWETAEDYQIEALIQDFRFVEEVYEKLKAHHEKLLKQQSKRQRS